MPTVSRCRRKIPRFLIPQGIEAFVTFDYPEPGGRPCKLPVKDISTVGVSFLLTEELPGLEVGVTLKRVGVEIAGRAVGGEIVVMHVTPGGESGATCGAMFYPYRDEDVGALEGIIRDLGGDA